MTVWCRTQKSAWIRVSNNVSPSTKDSDNKEGQRELEDHIPRNVQGLALFVSCQLIMKTYALSDFPSMVICNGADRLSLRKGLHVPTLCFYLLWLWWTFTCFSDGKRCSWTKGRLTWGLDVSMCKSSLRSSWLCLIPVLPPGFVEGINWSFDFHWFIQPRANSLRLLVSEVLYCIIGCMRKRRITSSTLSVSFFFLAGSPLHPTNSIVVVLNTRRGSSEKKYIQNVFLTSWLLLQVNTYPILRWRIPSYHSRTSICQENPS